ncbi:MAG: hypothetical protein JOZ94_16975 [Xanthobacteraceae bacterium]|nr:hypothetical protein [Xanthobacteraceae bacterium]
MPFPPARPRSAASAAGAAAEALAPVGAFTAIRSLAAKAVLVEGATPIRIVDAPIAGVAARALAIEIIGGALVVRALPAVLGAPLPAVVRVLIHIAVVIRVEADVIPRACRVAIKTGGAIGLKGRIAVRLEPVTNLPCGCHHRLRRPGT